MHRTFSKLAIVGAAFAVIVGITVLITGEPASKLRVQPASPHRVGVPDDWSHHHLVFSDIGTYEQAIANGTYSKWINLYYDPRYIIQQMKRNRAAAGAPEMTTALEAHWFSKAWKPTPLPPPRPRPLPRPASSPLKLDWSQSMNSASAKVGADNYPAKYSWYTNSPTTANCAGGAAPDYVAYNTGVAGSSTQASIIAYDNLYATTCSGTVPQTYWAYNTGGTISTSVSVSELGDQVAFIHSASTASLVLLKWSATGGAFTGSTSTSTNPTHITSVSIACTSFVTGTPLYGPGIATGATEVSCSGSAGSAIIVMSASATATGTTQPLTYSTAFTGTTSTTTNPTNITSVNLSCTPLVAGTPLSGPGIPQGATVVSCSGTAPNDTVVMSASATASGTATLTYTVGTAAAPVALTANSNANYRACVAPCMTTISFGSNNDTISSPFVDYLDDIIYVGDSSSNLHKFTNVFKGTPAAAGSPWPVLAGNSGHPLTSPVFDSSSQLVYVCNYVSNLTEVTPGGSATSSANIPGAQNDIQEGPAVDSSAARVYVFVEGASNNYIDQFATGFSSGANPLATVNVGSGSSSSQVLFSGSFDNAYYTTGTGNLYVCGNTNASPILYQIPITSGAMSTTANTGPTLTSASTQCSPLNEVYNDVLSGGPYDWIYAGVNASGSASGCGGGGCVMGVTVTSRLASTTYTAGQRVVDNHFHIEVVTTAGTSSSGALSWPASTPAGTTTTDGGVTWTSQGAFTFTGFTTGGHAYALNAVIVDSNNNLQRVTTAGTAASGAPSWNANFGGTTTSNTVTFTNQGPLGIIGSAYNGGTSGIVIDNISTASGASNIYFSTLGTGTTGTCAANPGTHGGCAIQASQSAP